MNNFFVPVVQRIEHQPSKLDMGVRFLPGTLEEHKLMVAVAQLAELRTVAAKVAGSNPVGHPVLLVPLGRENKKADALLHYFRLPLLD